MSATPRRKHPHSDIQPNVTSFPQSKTSKASAKTQKTEQGKGGQPHHSPTLSVAQAVPTLGRRLLAWSLEVAVLASSVAVPFYLGSRINQSAAAPRTELTPMLQRVQTGGARLLGVSPRSLPQQVTPMTNLLWSVSLGLPLVLAAGHIYSVGRHGRSWPKRWVGVQVLSLSGQMPGLGRALLREAVGKWGSPLVLAYGLWQVSGAFPVVGVFAALGALAVLGESVTGLGNRPRRAWHDWLAGTCVVDQETGAIVHLTSLWDAEATPASNWKSRAVDWFQGVSPNSVVLTPETRPWRLDELTLTKMGLGLGLLLILGGLAGTGSYFLVGRSGFSGATADENLYANLVSTLTDPTLDASARRAAVLALGNLPDDRVTPLLVDLIAQTDDPLWLDALQQALVARGPEAFPPLRRLNQGLSADLAMQNNLPLQTTHYLRLQTVNRIITKLLLLEGGDRTRPLDLSRMNLGFTSENQGEFRLVLKNQDLSNIHWQGSVLSQAQLQGARFYHPGEDEHPDTFDDRTGDLSGADLSSADLTGADLTLGQLVNAGLPSANLNRAVLTLANLSGANLEGAKLIQTTLDGATLTEARLSKADLTEATVTRANLEGARLAETSAAGANLAGANLQGIAGNAAILTNADLTQATLANADLTGAVLKGANLQGADLTGARLRDTDLREIRLQGALLNGTDFAGAILSEPTNATASDFVQAIPELPPGNLYQGVDFNRAQNLDSAQLEFICAQGGLHAACGMSPQE